MYIKSRLTSSQQQKKRTNMFHQQITFIVLFCLLSSANGGYDFRQYPSCKQFENKIYQVTVTFPSLQPLFVGVRLRPNGMFDEICNIGNGNNEAELGANFGLSTRVGYYKCLPNNKMRITGYGYLYKNPDISFLATNGAVVMHDFSLQFDNSGKTLTGNVTFAAFTSGTNPFDMDNVPIMPGPIGVVTGELLRFRARYDLDR